jgi:anti-sigma regulatory factor (Ser/Thr protein kinase)
MGSFEEHTLPLTRSLAATTAAPGEARRAAAGAVRAFGEQLVDDVRLVVSELVSNIVAHSGIPVGSSIELRVIRGPTVVRVELQYAGTRFTPAAVPAAVTAEAGRGLYIVDRVTDRWGIDPTDGLVAWAEWDVAAPVASARNMGMPRSG